MSGAPYLLKEDISILRYIIDGDYAGLVAGNSLWRKMQEEKVCPGRSWESLKNRFKRSIAVDISRPEYGLTSEEKVLFRNVKTQKTRLTKETSQKNSKKQTRQNASASSSDEVEPTVAVTTVPKSTVGAGPSSSSSAPREESATPPDKQFYTLDMEWSDSD